MAQYSAGLNDTRTEMVRTHLPNADRPASQTWLYLEPGFHNTRSPTKAHTQTYWISEVLRTADIHQLDFFRLAQNRDPTKWDALIKQAFPHRTLTTAAKRALNNWRPGHPLPDNTQVRRRRTRTV